MLFKRKGSSMNKIVNILRRIINLVTKFFSLMLICLLNLLVGIVMYSYFMLLLAEYYSVYKNKWLIVML